VSAVWPVDRWCRYQQRRRLAIGVGAQSTLGGTQFLPEKYVLKISKKPELHDSCPKNYQNTEFLIFARKIYKIPEFYMIFVRKMREFYIIIARKIFFLNFREHVPPCPRLLYTPMRLALLSVYAGHTSSIKIWQVWIELFTVIQAYNSFITGRSGLKRWSFYNLYPNPTRRTRWIAMGSVPDP